MKITAITCTGDRKICLDLMSRWISNQTVKVDQWLVIDDGKIPYNPGNGCEYLYRQPKRDDPKHTLNLNMEMALWNSWGDVILFMEDDEYYAPGYVEAVVNKIQGHEIAGICKSKYYNVAHSRYFINPNMKHASLAQTCIVKEAIPILDSVLRGDPFIDIRLWSAMGLKESGGKGVLFNDGIKDCLYVGIKGMPGRKGIGAGHKPASGILDKGNLVLKAWMPRDYQVYLDLNQSIRNESSRTTQMRGRI